MEQLMKNILSAKNTYPVIFSSLICTAILASSSAMADVYWGTGGTGMLPPAPEMHEDLNSPQILGYYNGSRVLSRDRGH